MSTLWALSFRCVLLAFIPFLLAGCEGAFRGEPMQSRLKGGDTFSDRVLDKALSEGNINKVLGTSATGDDGQLILARMAEIDLLYNDYEIELLTDSQKFGFASSLAGILTSAAGTVSSGNSARNLALASTVAQSGRTAFQKEVLAERTINALISQMRASRARVKSAIYAKLGTSQYTVVAALSDLELYQQAGTLASALVALGETVAQEQKQSEENAETAERKFLKIKGVETEQSAAVKAEDLNKDFISRKTKLRKDILDKRISSDKVRAFYNQTFTDGELAGDVAGFKSTLEEFEGSGDPIKLAAVDEAARRRLGAIVESASVAQFSEIVSKLK